MEERPTSREYSEMNIKLAPAAGIKEQRRQFRASGDSAGAKGQPHLGLLRHD
jgi:hypothetical protein